MTMLLAMFSAALFRARRVTSQNDTFDFSTSLDSGYLALLEDI